MNESTIKPDNKLPDTPEFLLDERERAVLLLSFLPETKSLTLYCQRTGIAVATMELLQQAGKMPFLSQWKESQCFHPLFSLPQAQLLSWVRKNWNYIFKNNASDSITNHQKQQFCISFVAILHSLNCLDQQVPALPDFDTVNSNMQRLIELAYWYNYLDSKRFRFPTLRINKLNQNTALHDIGCYLDICDSVRKDWETSKDAKLEESKLEAARKAEKAVRGSHVRAISKKALWNWFLSNLSVANSKKYSLPEWLEWKEQSAKLWFSSEHGQLAYSPDDVNNIEEVFIAECSLGTTVSHAFNAELTKIHSHITNHLKIFDFDLGELPVTGAQRVDGSGNPIPASLAANNPPPAPGNEPKINEFNSRSDYIRAKCRYDISCRQYFSWMEKHGSQEESVDDAVEDSDISDTQDDDTSELESN